MTKQKKFEWEYQYCDSERTLDILLNDGINKVLDIDHANFFENLAKHFVEVNFYREVQGVKTVSKGVEVIMLAWDIRKALEGEKNV